MPGDATQERGPRGLTGGLRILVCLVLVAALLRLCSVPQTPSLSDQRKDFLARCMADGVAHRADLSELQVEGRCQSAWDASR